FAQFTPAPQGGGADDKFFSFFRVGNGNVHFREEGAGTNSVYVHVKRCHFKTQRTRHLHNGTLTGGIRRPVRKPDKSQCAGHIYNTTTAVFLHVRHYGTATKPRAVDIHIHHLVEVLDRKSTRLNSSHVKISYAVFCL